jgi:hypothetical protein
MTPSPLARRNAVRAIVVIAVLAIAVMAFLVGRREGQQTVDSGFEARPTPAVVLAIHDVARLEATSYHVEKIVEVHDAQARLWGLLHPEDTLLLVAAGDVVAGVDLAKVREVDVHADPATGTLRVKLPAPEVFSSSLDQGATHVYSRSTDVLAVRNEELEGDARRSAEQQMRKAAIDEGILDRARASAERTLRALFGSFGYPKIELDWADRG